MRDAPLEYTVNAGEQVGTTILTLTGPLTLSNLFAFQDELRRLESPVLILDLEHMSYMDSAGLGLLMNGYVSATNQGRQFVLACVSERVGALLELTKVNHVLKIFPSMKAAMAALQSQP